VVELGGGGEVELGGSRAVELRGSGVVKLGGSRVVELGGGVLKTDSMLNCRQKQQKISRNVYLSVCK